MVTSIFSFSYNVFKKLLFKGRKKLGLCSKELNLATQSRRNYLVEENFLKHGGKMQIISIFSFRKHCGKRRKCW